MLNDSSLDAHFVWGHHCVVGPPFLEAGCRLEIPARTIVTSPELWEPETARLEPARREPWPRRRCAPAGPSTSVTSRAPRRGATTTST